MSGAQRTFSKSDFLIQVDYMGVVQEVTHKLQVKISTKTKTKKTDIIDIWKGVRNKSQHKNIK